MKKLFKQRLFLLSIFSLMALISVSAAQAETYYPSDHSYNETRWGFDEDPCGKYEEIPVGFFIDDNREIVSAKLYITAHYNFVSTPPPPNNDNNENNQMRRAMAGDCDQSTVGWQGLVHPFYNTPFGSQVDTSMYLPNNQEVEIDMEGIGQNPMTGLHTCMLAYMKTSVFNQYVELTDARLEVEFR